MILATGATSPIIQLDHDYLVQLVSARSGLGHDQASRRVDDVIGKEKAAAEKASMAANAAREAAAAFSLYTFFSMLVGAFIAWLPGAWLKPFVADYWLRTSCSTIGSSRRLSVLVAHGLEDCSVEHSGESEAVLALAQNLRLGVNLIAHALRAPPISAWHGRLWKL